jgi:hypothetical protein
MEGQVPVFISPRNRVAVDYGNENRMFPSPTVFE